METARKQINLKQTDKPQTWKWIISKINFRIDQVSHTYRIYNLFSANISHGKSKKLTHTNILQIRLKTKNEILCHP